MAERRAGLAGAVGAFDRWADRTADRWRGRVPADVAATAASALGDHGLVWFLIAVASRDDPRRRRSAATAVAFTGVVTPVVNRAVKLAVGRRRPAGDPAPLPVRVPKTASFPSGHALAAWCAATMMARDDPLAPAYYALAAAVSWSRVHVRLHHATDVVAGSLLGVALGRIGRLLLPGSSPSGATGRHD